MTPERKDNIRLDHRVIIDMVEPSSKVLDLGCGDGELLSLLIDKKDCRGTGIELEEQSLYQCFERGLSVSQGDLSTGLDDYNPQSFDYVILNESLQQVLNPVNTILAALRVGKKVVVGVPNFCHFLARLQIFFRGQVPVTEELPYEWYNTPNLRFFSLKDFQTFCRNNRINILDLQAIDYKKVVTLFPNLFARIGIYVLSK